MDITSIVLFPLHLARFCVSLAFALIYTVLESFSSLHHERVISASALMQLPELLVRAIRSHVVRTRYPTKQLRVSVNSIPLTAARARVMASFPSSTPAASTTAVYAAIFPCLMELMTMRAFPFPLLGGVHVRSAITAVSDATAGATAAATTAGSSSGETEAAAAEAVCTVTWDPRTDTRRVKRGYECDITARVYVPERTAAASSSGSSTATSVSYRLLFTSVNTMLFMSKRDVPGAPTVGVTGAEASPSTTAAVEAVPMAGAPATTLQLAVDTGRKWAKLCGDYNPIHVHWVPAALFGMRQGAVAHGMCVVHQALAAMPVPASRQPRDQAQGSSKPQAVKLNLVFVRPIFLPSSVSVKHVAPSDAGSPLQFQLLNGKDGKVCISGSIASVPADSLQA